MSTAPSTRSSKTQDSDMWQAVNAPNPTPSRFMAENTGNQQLTPAGFEALLDDESNLFDQSTQSSAFPTGTVNEHHQMDTQSNTSSNTRRNKRSLSMGATSSSASSSHTRLNTNSEEYRKMALERNRAAASKCRQKKREWVQELQEKIVIASKRHCDLESSVKQLREELGAMKGLLLRHTMCDCTDIQVYLQQRSMIS